MAITAAGLFGLTLEKMMNATSFPASGLESETADKPGRVRRRLEARKREVLIEPVHARDDVGARHEREGRDRAPRRRVATGGVW